jgi:hypothetical protein
VPTKRFTFIGIHWAITCTCTECNQCSRTIHTYSLIYSSGLLGLCVQNEAKNAATVFLWKSRYGQWPMNFEKEVYNMWALLSFGREKNVDLLGAHSQNYDSYSPRFVAGRLLNLLLSRSPCVKFKINRVLCSEKCAIRKVMAVRINTRACCKWQLCARTSAYATFSTRKRRRLHS